MKKSVLRLTAIVLIVITAFLLFAGCSKSETAMEYKGEKISFNLYSYWLSQLKSSYVSSANDNDAYWNTKYENGQTYEDKMREIVDYNVKVNLISLHLFEKMGLKLSDKAVEEMELSLSDLLESYGSKKELNKMLSTYGINYNMLRH